MTELEFSIMYTSDQAVDALRLALKDFVKRHKVLVNLHVLTWDIAWSNLVKVALYKSGPDVSEIGTTWIDSFISMDVLRQFSMVEISKLGGPAAFLPSAWESGMFGEDSRVWAIPWLGDTRVIYYRRDFLGQAGIDEPTAFSTLDRFSQTLAALQQAGAPLPLAIPTAQCHPTLHVFASWVWQAGGRFISPNGKHLLLNTPAARTGIEAYFDLRRYLAPAAHNLTDSQTSELFRQGQAAVTISGHWTLNAIKQQDAAPEVVKNLGVAVIPGVPFVGGTDLVVWKNSRQSEAALALVRFLTSSQVQTEVVTSQGLLPTRLEALDAPPFTSDPHYRVISESLKTGRRFQAAYMWGLIEDKLMVTLGKIWAVLLEDPELDVDVAVAQYLSPLVAELNHTLSS